MIDSWAVISPLSDHSTDYIKLWLQIKSRWQSWYPGHGDVSLEIKKAAEQIRKADMWLTSSQIEAAFYTHWGEKILKKSEKRSLTMAQRHHPAKHYGCLLIGLWLMWLDFKSFHSDEESGRSARRSPATSRMCHSFIMISCPSELLILLKRNVCSRQILY